MILDRTAVQATIEAMPRQPRFVAPGLAHHVTHSGVRSTALFAEDDDRLLYLELMRTECDRFGVEILAWCLMTNHVHLLAVPERAESPARAVGGAHRRYTRARNFREGVRGHAATSSRGASARASWTSVT